MTTITSNSSVIPSNSATQATVTTVKTDPVSVSAIAAPTISSSNSSTVKVSAAGMSVVRTLTRVATAPMTVDQVLAASTLSPQTVIKDTAANIQSGLKRLAGLSGLSNISAITLSDTKAPTISVARTDLSGDLSSSANADLDLAVLKKITSSYTLNVTGLTVSDALTLKTPAATTTLTLSINATAEQISGNATALQTLAKAKSIATITLPASTTPKQALSITATQLKASPELLATVKGDYDLTITGVAAADALTTAGAADKVLAASGSLSKSAQVAIGDTSANLVKSITLLETAATAGRLTAITVSDSKALTLSEAQIKANSHALATQFSSGASIEATGVAAADIATLQTQVTTNSSLTLTKESVSDTAANIQANLTNLENAVKSPNGTAIAGIAVTDKGSLTLTNTMMQADLDALKTLSGAYKLTVTNISVADALALTPPSKDATLAFVISDTAANVSAKWDKLEVLAKAKTLAGITVTDNASSLLSMTAAQLKADADVLPLLMGDYKLSVVGVAVADLTKTLATKNVYAVTVVDAAATVLKSLSAIQTAVTAAKIQSVILTDAASPTMSISDALALTTALPNLMIAPGVKFNIKDTASNIIAHARNDVGAIIANAGTITLSDATTPNLTLADATTLKSITGLDSKAKYNVADSGAAIATQAGIANETILSGAASVTINKNFSISDAKAVTALKALTKGTPYSIADSATNILAQAVVVGDKILSGANTVTVVDTSANIVAKLDQLEALAKAGRIADIKFTDTPATALGISQAQLLTDAEALGKIISQKILPSLTLTPPTTPSPIGGTTPGTETVAVPTLTSTVSSATNNSKPVFSGTAGAYNTINLYNNNGSSPWATVIAGATGSWTYTPPTALADGNYSITAKAVNGAGISSAAAPAIIFTLDATPPAAPTLTGPTGASANNKPVLSGTAEANSTVKLYNNNGTTALATITAGLDGLWTYTPTTALPDGSYSLTAKATDPAGNTSVASSAIVFKIDVTAPAVPTLTGPSGTTTNNKPVLSGTAEANSTVKLYNSTSATPIATVTAGTDGKWTYTPTTALADGSYSLTAKATDAAGNVSGVSSVLTFTVNTGSTTAATMTWAADQANGFEQISQLALKTVATPKSTVTETINLTAGASYSFGASYGYSYATTSPTISMQILDANNTVVASSSNLSQVLNFTATSSGTYTIKLVAANTAQDAKITQYGFNAYQLMSKLPASSGDDNVDALLNGLQPFWLHPAGAVATPSTASTDLIHAGLYSLSSASSKHQLTYSFLTSVPANDAQDATGFRTMNQQEQQAVQAALSYVASVINVTFTLATTPGQGDINFGTNNQGGVSAGYANLPNDSGDHPEYLFLANDQTSNSDFSLGSYGWQTMIHEIGHTLGLKHPGNYNAGGGGESPPFLPAGTDNTRFSVMSYNQPSDVTVISGNYIVPVNPQSYMVYDLEALQYLYGANKNTTANQTINFTGSFVGMQTIWSPNGATINVSTSTKNNLFDLRQGAYSSVGVITPASQTTYDGKNNVGIAYGSVVDSVIGGSGNDIIYANADGDTIDGGAGANTVYLPGTQSDWTITTDNATGAKLARNNTTSKVTTLKQVQTIAYYDPATTALTHA